MRAAEQFRYLVLAAQREGNRQLQQALAPLGLSPSQAEVLRILGDHEPLSLSALGELLVCESGTNPSRLVDGLVVAGLVERVPGTDRRRVELTLTIAGREREAQVGVIENAMYDAIDEVITSGDVLAVLRNASAGSPSGSAVAKRIGQ